MKTYELNELKSSIIQYNKKVPKFLFWIVSAIAALLISLIVLAGVTNKEDVIRQTGVFSTNQKSNIVSLTGGEIKTLHKINGSRVEKGDLLISLNTLSVEAQIKSLEAKIDYLENTMTEFDVFIEKLNNFDLVDLDNNENPFEIGEAYFQYNSILESLKNIKTTKTDEKGNVIDKDVDEIKKDRQNVINQYLQQQYSQKKQYQYELSGILGQKAAYESSLAGYCIYANESGYVNYYSNLTVGMVIGNDPIGSISDLISLENGIVEGYIEAQYRLFVKVEDNVELMVAGLPQSDYGLITGKVLSISGDSVVSENQVLYKIVIKPNSLSLSKNGNQINLINGQVGEFRIRYNKTTWLNWALEKLGIINQ